MFHDIGAVPAALIFAEYFFPVVAFESVFVETSGIWYTMNGIFGELTCFALFFAFTVILKLPAFVGVPVSFPSEFMLIPLGSPEADHVMVSFPSVPCESVKV